MVDMGVPGYLVASSVIAILAQRLVRVICTRCKVPNPLSEAVLNDAGIPLEIAKTANFVRGKGCNYCNKKGFRGRLGIFELLLITSKLRELIFKNASAYELRMLGISQGMRTLYIDGLDKVVRGITTLEEVYRSAKRMEGDEFKA